MSGQRSRLLIYSIQRCDGWADMGQWVVSVLALEPLHLTVTLTSRVRWQQGCSTSHPRTREGSGSTAGRWQVHEKPIRSPGDAMSFPWPRTPPCQELPAGQFTASCDVVLAGAGIEAVKIALRVPRANAYAERFVLTARTEVTNRMLIFGVLIAAGSSARPGPTTPSPTSHRSASSVGPSPAASSTSTSEPHRRPVQNLWPSSGTQQGAGHLTRRADPPAAPGSLAGSLPPAALAFTPELPAATSPGNARNGRTTALSPPTGTRQNGPIQQAPRSRTRLAFHAIVALPPREPRWPGR